MIFFTSHENTISCFFNTGQQGAGGRGRQDRPWCDLKRTLAVTDQPETRDVFRSFFAKNPSNPLPIVRILTKAKFDFALFR